MMLQPSKIKRIIWPLTKVALAGAMLWLLSHYDYIDFLALAQARNHPWLLALALVLALAPIVINGLRWHLLLVSQGIQVTAFQVVRGSVVAGLSGVLLPGLLGVDLVRSAQSLVWGSQDRVKAVTAVLMDRILGMCSLLALTALWCLMYWEELTVSAVFRLVGIISWVALLAVVIFLCLGLRVGQSVADYLGRFAWMEKALPTRLALRALLALTSYRRNTATLLQALLLGLASSLLAFTSFFVLALSLDIDLGWGQAVLSGSISGFAAAMPLTPGGLGLTEAVFSQTCHLLYGAVANAPFGNAVVIARILNIVGIWLLLPFFLARRKK